MRKTCDGCAYNKDDLILMTNCVGCAGIGSRPHYVPEGANVPVNWWNYKGDKYEKEEDEGKV